MSITHTHRGFTLIELMVSVGLFSVVMTMSAVAYLSLLHANARSEATANLINDMSVTLENMARSIRAGTVYSCTGSTPGTNADYCLSSSGQTIASSCFSFQVKTGGYASYFAHGGVMYKNTTGSRTCAWAPGDPITDPNVYVDSLKFYGTGISALDKYQPRVVIVVSGHVTVHEGTGGTDIPFSLQTQVTQRATNE